MAYGEETTTVARPRCDSSTRFDHKPLDHQPGRLPDGPSAVVDLDFSSSGRFLAATFESPDARHRNAEASTAAVVFSQPTRGREGQASSPQTQWNLVDLRDGRVLRSRVLSIDVLSAMASPDHSRVAATGSGGEMGLLDGLTGRPVRPPVSGHDTDTDSVMFSSDGKQVVTAAVDGTSSLWDGRTGSLLGTVELPEQTPLVAAFLYGEQDLLIASAGGWRLQLEHQRVVRGDHVRLRPGRPHPDPSGVG